MSSHESKPDPTCHHYDDDQGNLSRLDEPASAEELDIRNEELEEKIVDTEKESAKDLLENGRKFLRLGEIELAVEKFSESVETKLEELGISDGETHPSLGEFYLEYGNALLKNAEASNELFQVEEAEISNGPEENQTETDSDREENLSDEQLAWEILELARLCYSAKLEELNGPLDDHRRKTVEDSSFIHLRLGDLLIIEEKYTEAEEEYQKALNILMENKLPYTCYLPSTIALAQTQLCCRKIKDSHATFKTAYKLITDQLNGIEGETVPEERLQDFVATQEDLQIQIDEIERIIQKEDSTASSSSSDTAQKRFLESAGLADFGQSEKTFAPSQLKSATGETFLGVIQGKKATARAELETGVKKRPREDMTGENNREESDELNLELQNKQRKT